MEKCIYLWGKKVFLSRTEIIESIVVWIQFFKKKCALMC